MQLNNKIKAEIDKYFDSVTPAYLFNIAVTKYKFIEVGFEISGNFTSMPVKQFNSLNGMKEDFPIPKQNETCNYTISA